ncbi:competence protein CoiA [Secundilactobacillus pentosiphilus]|uniref:Competence protein CoiA n=1 Tax=Secundilactobacillus pentosiphilus TaxID=1714682 RepID=A0A1Z5IVR9_9LACO|nr:competence protein CoiA family protein [Secundilactobacillus pentosiphilus]GAX05541.1 competence protein CoiA [Secundilactobacillus pentosiphilus]
MLTAQTEQNQRVAASDAQRGMPYFCPSCREQVILKRGTRMMAHFAHRPNSNCRPFSESESQKHLTGKWQLAAYFGRKHVELEPYLQLLAQRPDLLVKREAHQLAVEYQCSPISAGKLRQRNQGYHAYGLEVIWILGEAYLQTITSVRHAEKWLQYSDKLGWYLIFWETRQQCLIVWHHLTIDGLGGLQGWARTSTGNQVGKRTPKTLASVQKLIQRRIQMGLHYKNAKWLKLQQFCYEHQRLLQAIPPVCYQFTNAEPLVCESPIIWAALMTVLLSEVPVGSLIRQLDLEKWAAKISTLFDGAQLIQCTTQQLANSWGRQLQRYADLLEQHGILKELAKKSWQLIASPY